jgi:segregation and condensation protein A
MALDAQPHPQSGDEETRGEPIYPMGPPLRVPADSVELTFLALDAPGLSGDASGAEAAHPGLEIKTPLGVRLPVFEGPLDLLLYLIRRDKVDIYDIPIGPITERYLGMLHLMKELDLDVAGDFLVMAATLMRIKVRMLLPTWPEDDEDEEDPRNDLVRQLLEYRRFKEAASALKDKEEARRLVFGRGFVPRFAPDAEVDLEPVSHFLLIDVMREVLARVGERFFYEVELEDVRIEEKMALVRRELEEKGRVLFIDLISRFPRRLHVVVTFMAILEMSRLGQIALAQEAAFRQIWIYPVTDGRVTAGEPEPAGEDTPPGDPETESDATE